MKTVEEWFAAYGKSHQNPTNKLIHWICIPLIMISLLGLLRAIPLPGALPDYVNVASIFIALCLLFYIRLSWQLGLGMLIVVAFFMSVVNFLNNPAFPPLWLTSLIIFFGAWVGQFIGHKIEGAKPSFFEDLQFLLIGPLWLLGFIYKRLGLSY